MKSLTVSSARKKLAVLWFSMSGLLFVIVFIQTLTGYYGDKVNEAWAWVLPLVLPTLSLIIGVFVSDPLNDTTEGKPTSGFVFRLAIGLSSVYLLAIMIVAVIGQLTPTPPLKLMTVSSFGLGPLGGLVTAAVGIFFVKKKDS
jgi:hypothetical protein